MKKFKLYMTFIIAGTAFLLLAAWAKDQLPQTLKQTQYPTIRAVYLVGEQRELDQSELAKHPEVVVVGSFVGFQKYAKQKVALWIDKSAVNVLHRPWLDKEPQRFYPIVLVGYGDAYYSFHDILGLCCSPFDFGLSSDSSALNIKQPNPGFSVIQLRQRRPGNRLDVFHLPVNFMEGYTYKPHVEDILIITNGLLDGTLQQPTFAPLLTPTFSSDATPTLPF